MKHIGLRVAVLSILCLALVASYSCPCMEEAEGDECQCDYLQCNCNGLNITVEKTGIFSIPADTYFVRLSTYMVYKSFRHTEIFHPPEA
jgi:hypothetical protein